MKFKLTNTDMAWKEVWLVAINKGDITYKPNKSDAFNYHKDDLKKVRQHLYEWDYEYEEVE